MNNISQSAIYEHLEEMLKIAEDAEKEGRLEDDGKTVASIKETMERIKKDTRYSQIIANIRCCPEFPCDVSKRSLWHTNVNARSAFYTRGIEICTDCHFYQHGILLLCNGVEGSEMFAMLNSSEREDITKLFGL